jgi:tryptophan synthase alpha chain
LNAIGNRFSQLKTKGEAALIGYVMAGDPTPELTPIIAEALIRGGIDILELGIPFSDPIADGPTIQAASTRALNAGTTPKKALEIVKAIKSSHDIPVLAMTYYNPVFKMGLEKFFAAAKACSVDGIIVPDLPIEEAAQYRDAAAKVGVDTVFLAAPSTSDARLSKIVEATSGFLYLVSRLGVTGTKFSVEDSTISLVKKVLPFTAGRIPLAVGFGISRPEHVKRIAETGADGVIVGSAFVNIIGRCQSDVKAMIAELEEAARNLKKATRPKSNSVC